MEKLPQKHHETAYLHPENVKVGYISIYLYLGFNTVLLAFFLFCYSALSADVCVTVMESKSSSLLIESAVGSSDV